jgi:proliferating cell nuclear antigen
MSDNDFRLKLESPKVFIKLVEILGKLLDYADLSISSKGLILDAMDASHVLQVHLFLAKNFFNECKVETSQMIRVDLQELNRIFKRNRGDAVFLMDSNGENKLLIQMQGDIKRNFKAKLYPGEADAVKEINPIDYKATAALKADELAQICGDASLVSDYATFSLYPDVLNFLLEINAGDEGEFNAIISKFVASPIVASKQTTIYSLEYLRDIAKMSDIAEDVSLRFASELPIELEYSLEAKSELIFTLAPRIEEEEEPEAPKLRIEPFPEDSNDADDDIELENDQEDDE